MTSIVLVAEGRSDAEFLRAMLALTRHHRDHCPPYAAMLERLWPAAETATTLAELPFLPVSLFKRLRLASIPNDAVAAELTSSGTTGGQPSRVVVDSETMNRQNRALSASLKDVLGARRLPMLLVDTAQVLRDPTLISARGAGLLGVMRHGRDHVFALDPHMQPDRAAVRDFLARHGGAPFAVFGFTFMVWRHLARAFAEDGLDLSNGILLHSGGWKAMAAEAVDNAAFRRALAESFGLTRVHNFYGMAEQLGSIHMEGEDGWLYPPPVGAALIRDPATWAVAPPGTEGVIQVLSTIPTSYPGHSLLTEDWGVAAPSGAIRVLGRVARAPLRGCSDVLAAEMS